MIEVAKHCTAKGKIYAMNISAPFICEVPPFKAALTELMPHIDYLFGNENEARAFAKSEGWETEDIEEIAKKASEIPGADGKKLRKVIITQGSEPTCVAVGGEAKLYEVPKLSKNLIVDTNGAGDSFVAGFLAGISQDLPIEQCIKAGNYAAATIIQHSGCAFPETCEFGFTA